MLLTFTDVGKTFYEVLKTRLENFMKGLENAVKRSSQRRLKRSNYALKLTCLSSTNNRSIKSAKQLACSLSLLNLF